MPPRMLSIVLACWALFVQLQQASAVPEEEYSATCACALLDRCARERPEKRLNYDDDRLNHFPDRQFWHWRKKPEYIEAFAAPQVEHTAFSEQEWHIGDSSRGTLPSGAMDHVHTSCDLPGQQVVYLTYDDAIKCEGKSDACNKHRDFLDDAGWLGVNVTMFVNTINLVKDFEDPPLHHRGAVAMAAEYVRRGHHVASHTHSHKRLGHVAFEDAKADIVTARKILEGLNISSRHIRPGFLSVNDRVMDFLVNTEHYEVWGGINAGGCDWTEWELPAAQKDKFPTLHASTVRSDMEKKNARCARGETYSGVLTLHDRPHELHFLDELVAELCRVCPRFTFPQLGQCPLQPPAELGSKAATLFLRDAGAQVTAGFWQRWAPWAFVLVLFPVAIVSYRRRLASASSAGPKAWRRRASSAGSYLQVQL